MESKMVKKEELRVYDPEGIGSKRRARREQKQQRLVVLDNLKEELIDALIDLEDADSYEDEDWIDVNIIQRFEKFQVLWQAFLDNEE
jgi:hypothetical protein